MATIKCKCGRILRDDDPDYRYLLLADRAFDVEKPSVVLFGEADNVLLCPDCQRLWVFWHGGDEATPYRNLEAE